MGEMMKKVLIVDDDVQNAHAHLIYDLELMGITVITALNGQEGLELFKNESPDLTISDTEMPILSGPDMVKLIRQINSSATIITCSDHIKPKFSFPKNLPFFQKPLKIADIEPYLE